MDEKKKIDFKGKIRYIIMGGVALAVIIIIAVIVAVSCGRKEPETAEETTPAFDDALYDEHKNRTTEATEPTTEYEPRRVTLLAVGDNLIHIDFSTWAMYAYGSYVFDSLYRDMKDEISAADIAIINQEVPTAYPEIEISNYPCFNAPETIIDAVSAAGFDVLSMATNHTMDKGVQGMTVSLNYIHNSFPNLLTTGAYLTEEERNTIPVKEVNGIRIAFLNYTYGSNCPIPDSVYINTDDDDLILADVAAAKQQADFVVVLMHWGEENTTGQSAEQLHTAAILAEAGVDLVIGTHPHVVQPVKLITATTGHQTLIYYSLGNFIGMQNFTSSLLGGVAKITLVTEPDGSVGIESYDLDYCVTQWGEAYSDPHTIPWSEYTPELAAQNNMISYDKTFSYEKLQQIVNTNNESSDLQGE